MDILTATKDFETWISRHTPVVKSQLSDKHADGGKSGPVSARHFL